MFTESSASLVISMEYIELFAYTNEVEGTG